MKKLIASVFAAFIALVSFNATAQSTVAKHNAKELKAGQKEARKELRKLKENQVSSMAKDNFAGDFDGAKNPSWKHTPMFDEVTFTNSAGESATAFYGFDSKLVGTTTPKSYNDLPADARKQIEKQYKGYQHGAVILYDDNEANESDMYLYGEQFEGRDHYFVTVAKDNKESVLMVAPDGLVSYFKQIK